jgi:hypothetical protein
MLILKKLISKAFAGGGLVTELCWQYLRVD